MQDSHSARAVAVLAPFLVRILGGFLPKITSANARDFLLGMSAVSWKQAAVVNGLRPIDRDTRLAVVLAVETELELIEERATVPDLTGIVVH